MRIWTLAGLRRVRALQQGRRIAAGSIISFSGEDSSKYEVISDVAVRDSPIGSEFYELVAAFALHRAARMANRLSH